MGPGIGGGGGGRTSERAQGAALPVAPSGSSGGGVLWPARTKGGRHRLYGAEHLERLDRIRELQAQRFSLAAIRAIVEANKPGLEGLFTTGERGYTLAELIERSGVDEQLVAGLREVGLLPDPAAFGGEAYDDTDLALLRAVAELRAVGMTPAILLA